MAVSGPCRTSSDKPITCRRSSGNPATHRTDTTGLALEFYNKIKRRSGKQVARTVVAKELAKITWHILTKNEPYKGFKGVMTPIRHQHYWPQSISPYA